MNTAAVMLGAGVTAFLASSILSVAVYFGLFGSAIQPYSPIVAVVIAFVVTRLVHGGLCDGAIMWSSHVPHLAREHRVLMPDSRGHGRTDNPSDRLAYDQMADDVAEFIAALELERPVVVGYSDGAQIALELGLRHPASAGGLVLGGVVAEPSEEYLEVLRSMGFTEPGKVDFDRFGELFPDFFATVKDLHRHVYGEDYWRRFMEQTSTLWLSVPHYSDEQLASIPVPTLVLTGDRDGASFTQSGRLFRAIPEAELAVVPGADHGAADRPLFRDLVLDFLNRH